MILLLTDHTTQRPIGISPTFFAPDAKVFLLPLGDAIFFQVRTIQTDFSPVDQLFPSAKVSVCMLW